MSKSKFKLFEAIVNLSVSNDWDNAVLEWHLEGFERADINHPETCLCGKPHIIDVCILRNSQNNESARVGNVCVNKFMGLPSAKILNCLKKIQKEPEKGLNMDTIRYVDKKGWFKGEDKNFSIKTEKQRNLSPPQLQWRIDINKRIIQHMRK